LISSNLIKESKNGGASLKYSFEKIITLDIIPV
jgi:hypothetical protein